MRPGLPGETRWQPPGDFFALAIAAAAAILVLVTVRMLAPNRGAAPAVDRVDLGNARRR